MYKWALAVSVALLAFLCQSLLQAQTAVTLTPAAAPTSGQPGVTNIVLTGSGFPEGTILPASTNVSLMPAAGGSAVETKASAVTIVLGSTRRVSFTIPSTVSVTTSTVYRVSVSGATTTGVAFAS